MIFGSWFLFVSKIKLLWIIFPPFGFRPRFLGSFCASLDLLSRGKDSSKGKGSVRVIGSAKGKGSVRVIGSAKGKGSAKDKGSAMVRVIGSAKGFAFVFTEDMRDFFVLFFSVGIVTNITSRNLNRFIKSFNLKNPRAA
jgi:hypothetical protein